MSVAGGVSRKTFTQFSKREKLEKRETVLAHARETAQHLRTTAFDQISLALPVNVIITAGVLFLVWRRKRGTHD